MEKIEMWAPDGTSVRVLIQQVATMKNRGWLENPPKKSATSSKKSPDNKPKETD